MAATAEWSQVLSFIWTIRDEDLRHVYERHEVGDVILPLVVIRRLDAVLAPTKAKVLARAATLTGNPDDSYDLLCHFAGQSFYNTSQFDLTTLVTQDPDNLRDNLLDYLHGFAPNVREIIAHFGFLDQVERMQQAGISAPCARQGSEHEAGPLARAHVQPRHGLPIRGAPAAGLGLVEQGGR